MIRKTHRFKRGRMKLNNNYDVTAVQLVTTYWFLFIPVYIKHEILKHNL